MAMTAKQAELDAYGITLAEREKLAQLYGAQAPKTLWRVPIKHFSDWDFNWPFGPPAGARGPLGEPTFPSGLDDDCTSPASSTIECEDQVLGEQLPITGSDLSLNYTSERAKGRDAEYGSRSRSPRTRFRPG